MTEGHESVGPLLDGWTGLTPDPEAMEQVAALMLTGVGARHRTETEAVEPGEAQFRLLTFVWAGIAAGGYLAWDLMANWFSANPFLSGLVILLVCLSLFTPLLLLPILRTSHERGSSPC